MQKALLAWIIFVGDQSAQELDRREETSSELMRHIDN